MNLKLEYKPGNRKSDNHNKQVQDIIEQVERLGSKPVIISTNKLEYESDKKDYRFVSAIKNLKLTYKLEKGCLILRGTIRCEFKDGFRGKFICFGATKDESADFDKIKGIRKIINFSDPLNAIKNSDLQNELTWWIKNQDLVYNITQFDEFMDLFKFYQDLSQELNNEQSFKIDRIHKPYFFVSSEESKEFEHNESDAIYNNSRILIGYKLRDDYYEQLSNEEKRKVKSLYDVDVKADGKARKNIRHGKNGSLFLSNCEKITERDIPYIVEFNLVYLSERNGKLTLSGELNKTDATEYKYLNLYDMGQKIKVDSIDNSLRLINQGATGPASELLGYLIGDENMPCKESFSDETKEKYMSGLNESQRNAFLMATDGSPVSLIKGPPGTGKTHVINAIVQYIVKELNEKVVISSQTHVAIDNVLDKLMENQEPIIPKRITNRRNKYDLDNIDVTLYDTWAKRFAEHASRASNKALLGKVQEQMFEFKGEKCFAYSTNHSTSNYAVIGATTTTSAISGKKGLEVLNGYKWLIIDEVSKCPITEVLRYLPYVEKIILVGDDYQLAPLLEFDKRKVMDLKSYDRDKFDKLKAMYENSVFAKTLDKARESNRLIVLNENYRSVEHILSAYNVFYDNMLVGKRISNSNAHFNSKVLDNNKDIFFVEVLHGTEMKENNESRYNIEELEVTKEILSEVMKSVVNPEKVTVAAIFPYGAQIYRFQQNNVELINEAKRHFKSFEIDTIDAFQGKEADIVLCNTVLADKTSAQDSFLKDFRRINVAMSRAKDKLIIFGNKRILSSIEMGVNNGRKRCFFSDIINHIECNGQIIKYNRGKLEHDDRSKNTINFA